MIHFNTKPSYANSSAADVRSVVLLEPARHGNRDGGPEAHADGFAAMNWGGYVALLADCHIDASPTRVVRQIYHLREDQMAWLARTLDAALSVPTMLFMHPHP